MLTLVLLLLKNKKQKSSSLFQIHWILYIEFVSIWKHAVQLFLLRPCLSFELGATLFQSILIACSTVPCMILVLSYILHDRLWCGFILCLTCTFKTKRLHSLPLPESFTFDLFGKRIRAIIKTLWRISDGYGFKFPLSIVILYLYERPVLHGLWIWGGRISSNFTTSLFLTFHEFVLHLPSDAWLHLLCKQ